MLGRLRALVSPALLRLGRVLWRAGVTPNVVTLAGLLLSLAAPYFAFLGESFVVLVLLVVSLVCDLLDGAVAKASGTSSPAGALFDSVSDRVEELMFTISLGLLGVNWTLVMLFLGTSFLVSYLRATAMHYGINLEGVGLMERGERGLLTAASLLLLTIARRPYAEAVIAAGVLMTAVTVTQRLLRLSRHLKTLRQ